MNKVRRLREAIAEHGRQCDQIDRDHYTEKEERRKRNG